MHTQRRAEFNNLAGQTQHTVRRAEKEQTREWSGKIIIKYKKSLSSCTRRNKDHVEGQSQPRPNDEDFSWVTLGREPPKMVSSVESRRMCNIVSWPAKSHENFPTSLFFSSIDGFFVICGDFMFSPRLWCAMRPKTTRAREPVRPTAAAFFPLSLRWTLLGYDNEYTFYVFPSNRFWFGWLGGFYGWFLYIFLLCTLPQPSLSLFLPCSFCECITQTSTSLLCCFFFGVFFSVEFFNAQRMAAKWASRGRARDRWDELTNWFFNFSRKRARYSHGKLNSSSLVRAMWTIEPFSCVQKIYLSCATFFLQPIWQALAIYSRFESAWLGANFSVSLMN